MKFLSYTKPAMKNTRQTNINIHRDAWVEINISNLENNIREIKKNVPQGIKLLGVVKADAYGHGAVMLAPTMLAEGIDMLGVASIDEGADLRQANINCEVLVLGAVPVWAVESAVKNDLSISIFSEGHIKACEQAYKRTGIKPKVHIKLDTGMNRIGVRADEAVDFIKRVQKLDYINLQGIFTHLAAAEELDKAKEQILKWNSVIDNVDTTGLLLHILNTAGTICYDVPNSNMRRVGIALYGLYPDFPDIEFRKPKLKQLISLKGRIVNIHTAKEGEGVSYCHTFVAKGERIIATVPIGYADGVPRLLSNKIKGVVNGVEVPQVGNITMDQMMFDITGVKANIGDVITLLDEEHSIDEWANILHTINYELTCRLKVRLPRVYTRG
ncbi:MAG: alanine racemase [Candidatus Melainabacteria bacterium]|nr:MAG: alanine racemase [Candidatus Melainabacteria bacterium]